MLLLILQEAPLSNQCNFHAEYPKETARTHTHTHTCIHTCTHARTHTHLHGTFGT